MPEHLRALVVILALSLPVFWLARQPATAVALSAEQFTRSRNLWLAITLIAFLAHNFWLYLLLMSVLLLVVKTRTEEKLPLFFFLLFAVPMMSAEVPGFGGIRFIMSLSHVRVLTLVLLLPAYLVLRAQPGALPFGRSWVDRAILAYIAIGLALQWEAGDTLTNWLRNCLYRFIDIFLPYYVASRALRDIQAFRSALMSFVLAALLLVPIAVFEFARHWLLYGGLPGALGVYFGFGKYLGRGDSLRALASAGHSIALGYVMAVALALHFFLRRSFSSEALWRLGVIGLCAGLVVPIARGPWMGAAAAVVVLLLTGPDKMSRTVRAAALAVPLAAAVLASPYGDAIIDRLPFVGTVDAANVDYRQRLAQVSLGVVLQNPWFGAYDFMYSPAMEQMRQGEGIIDIVNSYLAVALSGGLTSFACFAGAFVIAWVGVAGRLRNTADKHGESHLLGRALLAALTAIMVTIATVSSIQAIPVIYWCVLGMCVAYARMTEAAAEPADGFAPRQWMPTFGRGKSAT